MPRSDSWKVEEIEPLVASYFKMLTMVLTMKDFRKADIVRSLAELIPNRSQKSIEYKMQNASAVLAEQQLPYVPGYAPKGHYQKELATFVLTQKTELSQISALSEFYAEEFKPPPGAMKLALSNSTQVLVDAPPKRDIIIQQRPPTVSSRDYFELESRSRRIGLFGEKFCVNYEKGRLRTLGRADLADKVDHVSVTKGDGLGYDIASFEEDGTARYIEVKTTQLDQYAPFLVTDNEVRVSESLSEFYYVYRVFNSRTEPKLFNSYGSIADNYTLQSTHYRAYR